MKLPYRQLTSVKQTPRGSVVVLGDHLLTDELPDEDAYALAIDINDHMLNANQRVLNDRYDVV